jgi:pimeloyl-ACP methyl ester carboxylesterase
MMQHLIENPNEPLPFKFGVFFSPGFCVAPNTDYNEERLMTVLRHFTVADANTIRTSMLQRKLVKRPEEYDAVKALTTKAQKEMFFEIMTEVEAMLKTRDVFHVQESDSFGSSRTEDSFGKQDFPRFFNAVYTDERLPIPTVHIRGTQDDPAPRTLALIAQKLCAPEKVIVVENVGVHEIPHTQPAVGNVARAIEKAYYMSQLEPVV